MYLYFVLCCVALFVSTDSYKINNGFVQLSNTTQRNIQLQDLGLSSVLKKEHGRLSIVHGLKASRGQFCYQAYLQFSDGRNYWSCGGSLVTRNVILTAAHCVKGARLAVVVLGAQDLSKAESGRVVVYVTSNGLQVHDDYDTSQYYNDIALVTMSKAVQLTKYICTVSVPGCSSSSSKTADSDSNNIYTVSGWGKTSDSETTYQLMYVNVSGQAQESCAAFYKTRAAYTVIDSQLCTSGSGGKSTCNGDSGGPLVQADASGTVVQQGIVSLGLSSCELSAPSVFTNVSSFTDWLCPKLS